MPERRVPDHPAGPARVLALAYGFFALAAGARSVVQLSVHPHKSLFAYLLSAAAAAIYLGAAILLVLAEHSGGRRVRVVVRKLCLVEFAGVVLVGALSLAVPGWFPDATVWSRFGSGYGWVPAVLPLLALWWLHRENQIAENRIAENRIAENRIAHLASHLPRSGARVYEGEING